MTDTVKCPACGPKGYCELPAGHEGWHATRGGSYVFARGSQEKRDANTAPTPTTPPALTEERLWELKAEARECLHRAARADLDPVVSRDVVWFSRELHAAWEENARLRRELARLQDVAGSLTGRGVEWP